VSTNEKDGTNEVTGKVIVKETSVGVPDVIEYHGLRIC
jgi:hypothetical protein